MGGVFSVNVQNSVVEDVTRVFDENINTCAASSTQELSNTVGKGGAIVIRDSTIGQQSSVNLECIANLQNDQTIESRVRRQLEQGTKSRLDGITFGFSVSANTSNQLDRVLRELNVRNIATQVASSVQRQNNTGGDGALILIERSTIGQVSSVANRAVLEAVRRSRTVTDLQTEADQKAQSTAIGIFSTTFMIVLLIVAVIWFVVKSSGGDDDDGGGSPGFRKRGFFPKGFRLFGRGKPGPARPAPAAAAATAAPAAAAAPSYAPPPAYETLPPYSPPLDMAPPPPPRSTALPSAPPEFFKRYYYY